MGLAFLSEENCLSREGGDALPGEWKWIALSGGVSE
ncbi:MAG: hypothetical protein ACD_45C00707G0001 [uncultured bacterium]|nr:MAG: hypothetical protein ACD_45C00707G0001 [uncultured bacterium]